MLKCFRSMNWNALKKGSFINTQITEIELIFVNLTKNS